MKRASDAMPALERLLPICGGGSVPRGFQVAESMSGRESCASGALYRVGDNATAKQLRRAFDAQAFAWFEGTYHNFLALYSSASRHLERRAVAHVEARKPGSAVGWRELYMEHKRLLQDRARQLDRLMLAIDSEGRRAPGVARSPEQAEGSPMARVVREALQRASIDRPGEPFDGVLLGSHTYMTLKSAAQYEIKGVPIAQLNNQSIKIRYNVFPPTRKDYLALFANALQQGSPHHLPPDHMRHCLEVGTGTGVLSFILRVDINEEAVINARDNRELLGKDEDQLDFVHADLFPPGEVKYDLVVCNPPWIPMPAVDQTTVQTHNAATDGLMGGVLDRGGDLLSALFRGLAGRLSSRGRLWLIYSDMSVKLGLQDELCDVNGLRVRAQTSLPARVRLRPQDPFHQLKKDEVLTLYDIVPQH